MTDIADGLAATITIRLRRSTMDQLRSAKRTGVKPIDLAASILTAVAENRLFAAVLDC